ncbi:mycothione reductase [Devriesea agamarum]|uniref:mycothione reductase n=1 Tax=Devriesea agamarum TaxID=472569 RepID=UPI00071E1E5D|nr:mycothione reductase [Devriesea agamarum]
MTHYDIAVIGSGSGNSLPGPEFADKSIVFIDKGVGSEDSFGGTCLNVGCIPTKMFVHTADLARVPEESSRFGLSETLNEVDWPAIRDRVFGRIDPISEGGQEYRDHNADNDNLTLIHGLARFTGEKTLVVESEEGSHEISADTIVIAAGSRPAMPPVEGLAEVEPHTSDSVMRLESLPRSMAILGSGFIAAEFAHVFASLGVDVTLIARSQALLRAEDADISARYSELAVDRYTVEFGFATQSVRRTDEGIEIVGSTKEGSRTVTVDELLVATGRIPNSDLLDVPQAGFDQHADGRIAVDEYQRVLKNGQPVAGVWALGDISSDYQLKHVANHELRTVKHNLVHPEALKTSDHRFVPHAVFGHPPIGAVGLTEKQARDQRIDIVVAHQDYSSVAYGWALEDTTGFAKIIAERGTGRIVGAHIIGPEAPTLIQILIQAMSTGQRVQDIVRTQYWIHPAMPELIENALLQLVD